MRSLNSINEIALIKILFKEAEKLWYIYFKIGGKHFPSIILSWTANVIITFKILRQVIIYVHWKIIFISEWTTFLTAPVFSQAINVGDISDHRITEASGLAASRIHPSVLYTHNDKGDSSRIFAVDADSGGFLAELNINHARNYDWEDIAVGGCPGAPTKSCIYIGNYVRVLYVQILYVYR